MSNVPQYDSPYYPPPQPKPQAIYQGPVMVPPENAVPPPAAAKQDLSFLQGCLAALCCCWLCEDCCCDPTAMCCT
ncbi:hypothetical protein SLE2022_155830 [Rubroshorea leprosula]